MTSESRLEIVGSSRSVRVFHGVWACSGVFLAMRWTIIEKVPGVAALWGRLCFAAKSLWRPVWTCCLAPYFDLGPALIQIRGQSALPSFVLSRRVSVVSGTLLGDMQPPTLDAC
jgi:hypothetical protein